MYKTTYGELLKQITSFESTGVLYLWEPSEDGNHFSDDRFVKLPPSKAGFKDNIMSLTCMYYFELRHTAKCLPRKKKKLLALHYKKLYNKLKKRLAHTED